MQFSTGSGWPAQPSNPAPRRLHGAGPTRSLRMSSYQLLINGRLVPGASTMKVINPATEEVIAECPRADAAQLDQAVAAAKAAFPAWSATDIRERRAMLLKIADGI